MTRPEQRLLSFFQGEIPAPEELFMRKYLLVLFDIAVLTGFGAYVALTIWRLPEEMRHRLFAGSLGLLARVTGMAG